jgi:hypothetical protein
MEGTPSPPAVALRQPASGSSTSRAYWLVLAILVVWQGWMSLSLFGPSHPFEGLLNDEPILSGRHPLHLYHSVLGAQTFWDRRSLCCYDPLMQAGYPKTPVYDSGSRPAELTMLVVRGAYRPQAYKLGFVLACLLAPLTLWFAASAVGLTDASRCLGVFLGQLVWWGRPNAALLDAGDMDILLAGLAILLHICLLARYHALPSLWTCAGIFATAALSWVAHPMLCALLAPAFLVYYISFGPRHGASWHFGLLGAEALALGLNAPLLREWLEYWWILSPLRFDQPFMAHRTLRAILTSSYWGDALDRALTWVLLGGGAAGIVIWNQTCRRPAARLLGICTAIFLLLSVGGITWDPLMRWGSHRLLTPALLFAALPAALALKTLGSYLHSRFSSRRMRLLAVGAGLACLGLIAWPLHAEILRRGAGTSPLTVGFSASQRSFMAAIERWTNADARILMENTAPQENTGQWAALLPLVTKRAYLGGLDPEAGIEHAFANFVNQELAGRPIGQWRDVDLDAFARRYNVGWVVCRTAAAFTRFSQWQDAQLIAEPDEAGGNWLFRLQPHSYVLQGQGRLLRADRRSITLADVVPEDGKVVLSMHYQTGMQVSPSRVRIEKDPDPSDPIPFIRLSLPGPVPRLVISWRAP